MQMTMAILFHNRFEPTLTTFFLIIDFTKEQKSEYPSDKQYLSNEMRKVPYLRDYLGPMINYYQVPLKH